MSDEIEDKDVSLVQSHVSQLMEHFDTVQVFATRHTANGTDCIQLGAGNWFARRGHVAHWMTKNDEDSREDQRIYREGEGQ